MTTKEILISRANLLTKARDNKEIQQGIIALCKKDILYFFDERLYTYKNDNLFTGDEPTAMPFIPFDFQRELITEVRSSIMNGTLPSAERDDFTNVFVEKSRQMWVSWVIMAIYVYGWIFHNHKYVVISQKAKDVDDLGNMKSLFEKARFMIDNLPEWMLPVGFDRKRKSENNKSMSINSPAGWSITGESANPNAGRSGTFNSAFMDEMWFMENAKAIHTALGSATPSIIYNSTPNGEGNEFFRVKKTTVDRIVNGEFIKQQTKWLRYHWSEHPLYDQKWYEWKTQNMSRESIAQELEIDYNTAIVGRVYTDFPKESSPVTYDPEKPLYIAIDNSHWGTDPNAVIIAQKDWVYLNIIDAVEIYEWPENCARFMSTHPTTILWYVQEKFLERYKNYNWRKGVFVSDPYDTEVAMGNSTIEADYKKVWINLSIPKNRNKEEQILKTRNAMYKIRYNDNCEDFASAIMNAKYPKTKEWSESTSKKTKPIHDWTSHYRTALEYLITYLDENPHFEKKEKSTQLTDRPVYERRKPIYW